MKFDLAFLQETILMNEEKFKEKNDEL